MNDENGVRGVQGDREREMKSRGEKAEVGESEKNKEKS